MEIIIKRIYFREECTVGAMHIGGEVVDCIEPHAIAWRDDPLTGQHAGRKIAGKTAIPEGTYRIVLRESKSYRRKLPCLLGVHGFKRIMIRTGKTASQSHGDILVGQLAPVKGGHPADKPEMKIRSYKTFNRVYRMIEEAYDSGESIWVTIRSYKDWKM